MKTKNIILIALLVLLTGLASCKKDHDIPTGKVFNGGSGGGSTTDSSTIILCDYSNIILNEINGNDKFIEFYNSGTEAINLNGVYLEKDGIQNWVADNTVRIEAGDYLLLYSEDVQIDHPNCPETLIFHSGISAKKNVRIQLFSPTGVSVDDFNLTNIDANDPAYIPAPSSYSRNADGKWYYADATPGRANVNGSNLVLGLEEGYTPEPPTPAEPDYTNLVLNELNGDTKFIEFYNKGNLDLSMEGMYIMKDDYVAGTTWTADATIVVPAHGYVVLYSVDVAADHPELGENMFFNSGISSKKSIRVTLFMPNGTVRDEFTRGTEWGQSLSNVAPMSYARTPDGGDWKLANPTPGGANPSTGEDIPDVETPVNYTIIVSANPSNGGSVTGGGIYQEGQSCTVIGTANDGCSFTNWTENGNLVSEDASYTFVVTSNRTLIANFAFVQDEGSGTFEDPYNVAAGIGLQYEEPIAWVHGYIVGAVKSGLSLVTSNADINWSAPFDEVTNVVIADDVTCREISQCIIVNLPAGKPLRTQVNLMDNPDNLGKHLAVNGKLRKYFGQAGLRDSNGTEADFVLEGVTPPTPGTVVFSESFGSGQGQFTIQDVFLPQELSYVWCHDSQFSFMRASAFVVQDYATESWLISPVINLSGVSSAKLTFSQAVNYASPQGALFMMISTNYNGSVSNATWTELNLDQWPAGNNWTFITSTADLTPYVGQTVTIAFKYTSSTNASATWEVKDFVVE